MRALATLLFALLVALQYRLWVGDGSLAEVWRLTRAIEEQEATNATLAARNEQLIAEVRNLKEGVEAIEERARVELGMIGRDETFFQIVDE